MTTIKLSPAVVDALQNYVLDPAFDDDEAAVEMAAAIVGSKMNAPTVGQVDSWFMFLTESSESAKADGFHGSSKALENLASKVLRSHPHITTA